MHFFVRPKKVCLLWKKCLLSVSHNSMKKMISNFRNVNFCSDIEILINQLGTALWYSKSCKSGKNFELDQGWCPGDWESRPLRIPELDRSKNKEKIQEIKKPYIFLQSFQKFYYTLPPTLPDFILIFHLFESYAQKNILNLKNRKKIDFLCL